MVLAFIIRECVFATAFAAGYYSDNAPVGRHIAAGNPVVGAFGYAAYWHHWMIELVPLADYAAGLRIKHARKSVHPIDDAGAAGSVAKVNPTPGQKWRSLVRP
jgi:hypothetical protein